MHVYFAIKFQKGQAKDTKNTCTTVYNMISYRHRNKSITDGNILSSTANAAGHTPMVKITAVKQLSILPIYSVKKLERSFGMVFHTEKVK